MANTNYLFIGAGRMAEAIISGLVAQSASGSNITVANQSDIKKLNYLEDTYSVQITQNWESVVSEHNVIILATPPQTQQDILQKLGRIVKDQLVVTVAAGIDVSYMKKRLPQGTGVCWIMPNTGAQIGKSMSIYTCGKNVTNDQRLIITTLLDAIGDSEELSEQQVHDLTAITGSAPAFVYSFAQALEKAAVANNISREQARKLVTSMIKGSVGMLENGGEREELISQVASPGGSTAEGLKVLEKNNFEETINEAVKATSIHARGQGV
ncbi:MULTISPECIES: pyrroline-5-carboxylate reductase [Bacillaceae]|uniref:Pyrroline-5-carboxylate reductase n=1 Tax=Evansella alkalicola TaxID=745819 RepID=A0ABS6JR72_9BACI|nr:MULTISPECIES: pyrroline-5-carboxylate reductase [Bacillaceae]MBU9721054.1 pyrroline-5-carboxylate reductase [Bacillus alkalicola]